MKKGKIKQNNTVSNITCILNVFTHQTPQRYAV